MSYVERHLLPGETLSYRTRLHWKVYLGPVLLDLLVLIPLTMAALVSSSKLMALVPLAGAVLALVPAWLHRRTSEFAVTNRRVIIKSGLVSARSIEILLPKIEAITVTQSVTGRMFGFGSILVTGSGGTHELFDNIQAPLDFRQAVQAAAG
ncbi:MAG: PH domain-containing protein [Gemmatimonadota bacterium]